MSVIGWAQAANWSPVTADTALPSLTLAVDTHTQQLNAYDGEQSILSAPVSVAKPANRTLFTYPPADDNKDRRALRCTMVAVVWGQHTASRRVLAQPFGIIGRRRCAPIAPLMRLQHWHNGCTRAQTK